ncbi:unnamed protein product [Acanthoscelides obtectus]|uniref:Nuclease HARBI1 n=1 Tax=Acanthoscelides obtectus TaxID=200917 RepID=A0A9P0K0I1_ACAOB|nr:unnamed protein product [Acanthoscelides obtectus]CAK1638158.1 Protein ANTAGONIST OF LIKE HETEROCHROMATIN PROTEIN 1 [Acanthoscelides obtectus]
MDSENEATFLFSRNVYFQSLMFPNPPRKRQSAKVIWKDRCMHGEFHHLYPQLCDDEELFFEYAAMSKSTFDYTCSEIRDECTHQVTNFKQPISVEERLMLTIQFLVTGISFRKISFTYRISRTAVANIVIEVCKAIWKKLHNKHMKFPSTEDFKAIAASYSEKGKFPHCCGSIDGKHIRVKKPRKSGSMFYNYKGFFQLCSWLCLIQIINSESSTWGHTENTATEVC